MDPIAAVILAAGEGTRMKSARPKPLHLLCGRAMLLYVLDALDGCHVDRAVVVVGHGAEWVTKKLQEDADDLLVEFVEQRVQRGTGDAALVGLTGLPEIDYDGSVLVMPGDTPLLRPATIVDLVTQHQAGDAAATILTAVLDDPTGYGRVIRGKEGSVIRVVEQSDATPDELEINEVNTSIYCFRRSVLAPALRRLTPENAQGEYYLTDVVEVLSDAGYTVQALPVREATETEGVNDRAQLARAEAELRRRTNEKLLRAGVTMLDPANTYVDTTVTLGTDVTLFPGTILQGSTSIGDGAEIGPETRLVDCVVGAGAVVEKSVGRDAEIGEGSIVGPFAVLEPGSLVAGGWRTGPFHTAHGTDADDLPG